MDILKKNYVIFFFFLIILEIKSIKVGRNDLLTAGGIYFGTKAYNKYATISDQEKKQARISFLLNTANNRFEKFESKNINLENIIISDTLLEKIQSNNMTLDLADIITEANNSLEDSSSREDDLRKFYALAGREENFSDHPDNLKKAYYQGARKLHPDKELNDEPKEIKRKKFQEFQELYKKLTKPNSYNSDVQAQSDIAVLYDNTNISLKELIIKQSLDSKNNDIKSFLVEEFFKDIKKKITKIKNLKTIDGDEKNNTNKNYLKLTQSIDMKIIYPLLTTLIEREKNINLALLIQDLMIYSKEVFKQYLDSFALQKNNIILNKTSSILNDQRSLTQIDLEPIENNYNEDDADEEEQAEEDSDEEEDDDIVIKKSKVKNSSLKKLSKIKDSNKEDRNNARSVVDLSFFNSVINNSSDENNTAETKRKIGLLSKEIVSSFGSNAYGRSKKQEIIKINNDFSLPNDKKIAKIENIKKDIEKNSKVEEEIKNNLIKLCEIVSFAISEKIIKEKKIDLLLLYTFFVVGRFIEIFINLIEANIAQKETPQFKNLIAIVNILYQYLKVLLSTIQFLKTYPGVEESKVMKIIENSQGENTSYYYSIYKGLRGAKEKVKSGVATIDAAIGLRDAGTALGAVVLGKTKVGNKLKHAGSRLGQKAIIVGKGAYNTLQKAAAAA